MPQKQTWTLHFEQGGTEVLLILEGHTEESLQLDPAAPGERLSEPHDLAKSLL